MAGAGVPHRAREVSAVLTVALAASGAAGQADGALPRANGGFFSGRLVRFGER